MFDVESAESRVARLRFFFFFNDTATTEIYTLSLHDALPIFQALGGAGRLATLTSFVGKGSYEGFDSYHGRSEEHTSELQSQSNLVCRLLLEKKKHSTQRRPTPNRTNSSAQLHRTLAVRDYPV